MGRQRVCFSCCLALVLICSLTLTMLPAAFAQETTAGLQGVVKDPTGAVIVGATVEVLSPVLIGGKKLETDHAGFIGLLICLQVNTR